MSRFEYYYSQQAEDDHFLMHMACMLQIVYLCRQKNLSPATKVLSFLEWNFKYLLIGQYTLTYIAMLFTNQEGMRAPKGANRNDIDVILKGCYNQAWDLNYLTNWSSYYWDDATMNEVFLFATADVMLKRIFINTHGEGDFFDLIARLSMRQTYDGTGNIRWGVDEAMRRQLENKLIAAIFKFKVA